MPRSRWCCQSRCTILAILLAAFVILTAQSAFALIFGGEGNKPIDDPGWPAGASVVFNQPGRLAYWEGPPFGGGQWHSECRGGANALTAVLAHFAKIDAKTKRLVLHDGIGRSFWLNPNNEAPKAAASQIDWSFTVWQEANWQRIAKMPPALKPGDMGDDKTGPPTQIDVYTGGNIRWADVVVPQGIEVIDDRLEAHGVSPADGTVLEGTITDLETKKPLAGRVEIQLSEQQKKGGYQYTTIARTEADNNGKWRLKNAPVGTVRIVQLADGYVPRVVGYGKFNSEPSWHPFKGGLLRSASVAGRVVDDAGKPMADVDVKMHDFISHEENYRTTDDHRTKTDADGRFHFDEVPTAKTRVVASKIGYCQPGLGLEIKTPAKDLVLTMPRSAQLNATVDFADGKRPAEYLVELEPEGGNVVGSWGGSSPIDEKNQVKFRDVPPGRYFLWGHPNPSSDTELSKRIAVDLKGGATEEVKLTAAKAKEPVPPRKPVKKPRAKQKPKKPTNEPAKDDRSS